MRFKIKHAYLNNNTKTGLFVEKIMLIGAKICKG